MHTRSSTLTQFFSCNYVLEMLRSEFDFWGKINNSIFHKCEEHEIENYLIQNGSIVKIEIIDKIMKFFKIIKFWRKKFSKENL